MRHPFVTVVAAVAAFCIFLVGPLAGQSAPASKTYTPPKTPWGEPDLQGNWPAQFNIPRERPAYAVVLSDEEVAQRQAQTAKQFQARQQAPANPNSTSIGPPGNWGEIAFPQRGTLSARLPQNRPFGRDAAR